MKKLAILAAAAVILIGCNKPTPTQQTISPMETPINNIMTRVSVRQFTGAKISEGQIDTLLRAGMAAPSAMNKQPWAFVVITDEDQLAEIGEAFPNSRCSEKPAVAIIPCGDLTKAMEGEEQGFWINDVSAATENILLAAHAMGLGAVWTGIHPSTERTAALQQMLGLPEHIVPLCIVPVGVPAEQPEVKQKYNPENIHYNKW